MLPSAALLLLDDKARPAVIELARQRELNVSRVYRTSRRSLREAFERIRSDAKAETFGVLLVKTLDLPELGTRRVLAELSALAELGVEVGSANEPFLTLKGPQGELVRWLHRRLSTEKRRSIADGIARSKKKPGRPRASIPEADVLRMAAKGMSIRAIARKTKLGASTIQRFLAAHRAAERNQETPSSEVREW